MYQQVRRPQGQASDNDNILNYKKRSNQELFKIGVRNKHFGDTGGRKL